MRDISLELATRTPRRGAFGGVLEGAAGDRDAMTKTVDELNALGAVRGDLEWDGGRFSLLLADDPIRGDRLDPTTRLRISELLQSLVDLSPHPREVESTLRCSLFFDDSVAEILLAPVDGRLTPVGRTRPITPRDLAPTRSRKMTRKTAILYATIPPLFLLAAYVGGVADPLLRPPPADVIIDLGPFDSLVVLQLEDRWPGYVAHLQRGSAYPQGGPLDNESSATDNSLLRRAALSALRDGRDIQADLVDDAGTPLAQVRIATYPLLDADAPITIRLPSPRNTDRIKLSLASSAPPQER